MAEQEYYRLNLVVEFRDRMRSAMERSRAAVNRMEKHLQRTKKAAEILDKQKIEPIMKIRDKLTAQVIKADKLINKLDLAKASPIIEVQDRVSSVVTRINAALNALDKGNVNVVADLKGPLMKEILVAKSNLKNLDVEIGPIAELRGELFSQLTKAMTELKKLDRQKAEPKATLRDRVTNAAKRSWEVLKDLTARAWTVTIRAKDMTFGVLKRIKNSLTSIWFWIGGGYLGKKAFDFTIGASAQMELARVQIDAMFRNAKKSEEYMRKMSKLAMESPIFGEMDIFQNSKSFVALTKRVDLLERMWKLTELLAAMDPIQGVEGAVFALRELFSGDAVSMVERFEMPRKVMNEIKNLPLETQIAALEKFFKKMGYDQKYLNRVSKTSIGLWTQIGEKARKAFRIMGEDGLKKITPQLERFNRWLDSKTAQRLTDFGSDLIGGLVGNTITAFNRLKDYVEKNYLSSKEFKQLDLIGKIQFVVDDLAPVVDKWLTTTAIPKVAVYGTKLGAEMIKAMGSSAAKAVAENPLLALLLGTYIGTKIPGPPVVKVTVALGIAAAPWVKRLLEGVGSELPGSTLRINKKIEEQTAIYEKIRKANESGKPAYGENATLRAPLETDRKLTIFDRITNRFKKHARGGILTKPHLGLVAEAGPEAIIPLSPRMRYRALQLYHETGRYLGVKPYESGGIAGNVQEIPSHVGGNQIVVQVSGNTYINLPGLDLDDEELALRIGRVFVAKIKKAVENRA